MKSGKPAKTVNDYIESLPAGASKALTSLRRAIVSSAPGISHSISYRIPFIKYGKTPLAAFAAFKEHCSFITMSSKIVSDFKDKLKNFKVSGTTIRFDPGKPLPAALVKKIVKARIKEISKKS